MADPHSELAAACGARWVRAGTGADTVSGRPAALVASPASTAEVAAVLGVAAAHGLRVVARGAGTKLGWGSPPRAVDLLLDTGRLDAVLEHAPGDLVLRAQAGVALAELGRRCGQAGQMLALDPLVPGGTVGGTLATNASGPRRLRYGTARDLLIGITVVRADGTVAHAGGKVVKNVAGYDLGKLFIGSYGTLGVITEAVFRLHPLPAQRAVVTVAVPDAAAATAAANRVRSSQFAVTALELDAPDPGRGLTLAALVEAPGDVPGRAAQVAALLGTGAEVRPGPPDWWGTAPWLAGGTAVKVSARFSRLPAALAALRAGSGPAATVRGSLGAGVLYAGLPPGTDPGQVVAWVAALRAAVPGTDGSVVVLESPVVDGLDRWGPVAGLDLMRRVKDQFDPRRLLAPGRMAGGI